MPTRRLGIVSVTPTPTARAFLAVVCLLLPIRGSSGGEAFPSPRQDAQPRPPVFRVEVNYVELAASVVDRDGQFVEGLAVEDFELYEDGERQEIVTFQYVGLPRTAVLAAERSILAESDVATNLGLSEARIFVLLLDDLHIAPQRTERVRRLARMFIEEVVREGDLVSVQYTSKTQTGPPVFTSHRDTLLDDVEGFFGRKLRSAALERTEQAENLRGLDMDELLRRDPLDSERGARALRTLARMETLSAQLRNVRGRRKVVVFLSEGLDYDFQDTFTARRAEDVSDALRSAIGAATRANVSFFSLDPQGLAAPADQLIELGNAPSSFTERPGSTLAPGPNRGVRNEDLGTSMLGEAELSRMSLRTLSQETGGIAIYNQNQLDAGLRRIVDESGQYYLLGYYTQPEREPGEFRALEIRTRQGFEVRARPGFAPGGSPSAGTRTTARTEGQAVVSEALKNPLPSDALPLRVFAGALNLDGSKARTAILVESSVDEFSFQRRDGRLHDQVELAAAAIDQEGSHVDSAGLTITLAVPERVVPSLRNDGFRARLALDLEPGRYQLRVGVHESGGARTGTVFHSLEIPRLDAEEMSLSSLFLCSAKERRIPIAANEGDRRGWPPMSTRRSFGSDDVLGTYVEVYLPESKEAANLEVETLVARQGAEWVVFKSTEPREVRPGTRVVSHEGSIPLDGLRDGPYILTVAVRLSGREDTAERAIPFWIE